MDKKVVCYGGIMANYLESINHTVWGAPMLILILGVGLLFSLRTGFAQIRLFPRSIRLFLHKLRPGTGAEGISSFQALCTALAATVGTGNLVGVAGAIAIGGPGSIFWMWVCAILGMMTKYAEATLAVYYRTEEGGDPVGGPMYMIRHGLSERWHFLASVYCFLGMKNYRNTMPDYIRISKKMYSRHIEILFP